MPVQLFNPFNVDLNSGDRQRFPLDPNTNSTNVIPQAMMSPVWNLLNAANAFPLPTGPIDNSGNNFNAPITETTPTTQFDIKLDHQLTNKVHLMGRYSQNNFHDTTPGLFFDGSQTQLTTRNVALDMRPPVKDAQLNSARVCQITGRVAKTKVLRPAAEERLGDGP